MDEEQTCTHHWQVGPVMHKTVAEQRNGFGRLMQEQREYDVLLIVCAHCAAVRGRELSAIPVYSYPPSASSRR